MKSSRKQLSLQLCTPPSPPARRSQQRGRFMCTSQTLLRVVACSSSTGLPSSSKFWRRTRRWPPHFLAALIVSHRASLPTAPASGRTNPRPLRRVGSHRTAGGRRRVRFRAPRPRVAVEAAPGPGGRGPQRSAADGDRGHAPAPGVDRDAARARPLAFLCTTPLPQALHTNHPAPSLLTLCALRSPNIGGLRPPPRLHHEPDRPR